VSCEHLITKYIKQAKEIEMDAVAKDGKMIMHQILEHIENVGVHSGDAMLIHPPQDLDLQTVCQIEEATAKISNVLNVMGPFNIQFITKNNEIKVIECNLRARSFPFIAVSLRVLVGMAPVPPGSRYTTPVPSSTHIEIEVWI
jgi:carbamoyl-phosphate synthase/aspartate carbamoyltransferase